MYIYQISATDLKNKTAQVMNEVIFGGKICQITRYGKIVAEIKPVSKSTSKLSIADKLDSYFGSAPGFKSISRNTKNRNIDY